MYELETGVSGALVNPPKDFEQCLLCRHWIQEPYSTFTENGVKYCLHKSCLTKLISLGIVNECIREETVKTNRIQK